MATITFTYKERDAVIVAGILVMVSALLLTFTFVGGNGEVNECIHTVNSLLARQQFEINDFGGPTIQRNSSDAGAVGPAVRGRAPSES